MNLRAVFLDVGNTLLHEEPSRFALYAQEARIRGVAIDAEAMKALMRRAHAELPREINGAFRYTDEWFEAYIQRIFADHLDIPPRELPELRRSLFARFEDPATFHAFPGAFELLEDLRRWGLAVGLISNWSARLPRVLEAVGIAPLVDFTLCSALERAEKPEPEIFRAALARAAVSPAEALHAGDDPVRDVAGAEGVGVAGVLVDHGGKLSHGTSPRVRSLAELARVVDERRKP